MPGPLPIDDVISKILRGIARAQKDYEYWTDGCWLQEAPEYMTTVYVAREICKTKDRGYYLTLESNARQTLRDAGGIGRGGVSPESRLGGKFDIVVYWADGSPRIVIELKKQVTSFKQLKQDSYRICNALRNPSNRVQRGLIAFYTSWKDRRDADPRNRIVEILDGVEHDAKEYLKNRRPAVRASMHHRRIPVAGNSAWVAAVLEMERA